MFPSPDQYFGMHLDQRRWILQGCATRMAPVVGGQIAWDGDGDVVVAGSFNGRNASLRIQLSFGTMFVEVKLPRQIMTLGLGMFRLNVDPHAAHQAGEMTKRSKQEDPGGIHRRQYLSPSVYFEGMTMELESVNNLMQRLPQPAQAALVQALSQFDRGFFAADSDALTLFCPPWIALGPQAPQYAAYYLNLLFLLSNDIDVAWREV